MTFYDLLSPSKTYMTFYDYKMSIKESLQKKKFDICQTLPDPPLWREKKIALKLCLWKSLFNHFWDFFFLHKLPLPHLLKHIAKS